MPEPQGQESTASGQAPQNLPTEPQTTTQASQEQGAETFDATYVRQLRQEAAGYRKRATEAEGKLKGVEDAQLSETEKLQKRLADLEREQSTYQRERQELTTRYAIERAAARLGIVDPDAAYRLLDLTEIEFTEDGTPKDVEKSLSALLVSKPYLAGQAANTGSPTNAATGGSRAGTFTQSQIADRTFWNAHRDEIMKAMAEGRITPG